MTSCYFWHLLSSNWPTERSLKSWLMSYKILNRVSWKLQCLSALNIRSVQCSARSDILFDNWKLKTRLANQDQKVRKASFWVQIRRRILHLERSFFMWYTILPKKYQKKTVNMFFKCVAKLILPKNGCEKNLQKICNIVSFCIVIMNVSLKSQKCDRITLWIVKLKSL